MAARAAVVGEAGPCGNANQYTDRVDYQTGGATALMTILRTAEVQGVTLHLGNPDTTESGWIGQTDVLKQLLACWLVVDQADRPLSPRLIGSPCIGKTTLGMAAARVRKQPLFIAQCTADTR